MSQNLRALENQTYLNISIPLTNHLQPPSLQFLISSVDMRRVNLTVVLSTSKISQRIRARAQSHARIKGSVTFFTMQVICILCISEELLSRKHEGKYASQIVRIH